MSDPAQLKPGESRLLTVSGVEFRCELRQTGTRSTAVLTVSLATSGTDIFTLSREGITDRIAKQVRLSEEFQTGDPAFDREMYVASESPTFARMLSESPERRRAVRDIFANGVTTIEQADGVLSAVWAGASSQSPNIATATRVATHLVTFAGPFVVRSGAIGAQRPATRSSARWRMVSVSFILLALLLRLSTRAFIGVFYSPLDRAAFAWTSLEFSVMVVGISLFVAIRRLRGRSTAHRALLVWVPHAGLLPFASFGLLAFVNGAFDFSPAIYRTRLVLEKFTDTDDGKTTYHVDLRSWTEADEIITFWVLKDMYDTIVPKQTRVTIITKRGALGHEWLVQRPSLAPPPGRR